MHYQTVCQMWVSVLCHKVEQALVTQLHPTIITVYLTKARKPLTRKKQKTKIMPIKFVISTWKFGKVSSTPCSGYDVMSTWPVMPSTVNKISFNYLK